jgi:opacity protein-like surface antigen
MSSPSGYLTDYHGFGFSVGGGFAYEITPHVAINILSVAYDRFPLDQGQVRSETGLNSSGASVGMMSVMGGLKARFIPEGFSPYVGFNAGLVHASFEDLRLDDGTYYADFYGYSENAFGISAGAGMEGPVSSSSSAFAELNVTSAFTDGESTTYIPVKAGMRFRF